MDNFKESLIWKLVGAKNIQRDIDEATPEFARELIGENKGLDKAIKIIMGDASTRKDEGGSDPKADVCPPSPTKDTNSPVPIHPEPECKQTDTLIEKIRAFQVGQEVDVCHGMNIAIQIIRAYGEAQAINPTTMPPDGMTFMTSSTAHPEPNPSEITDNELDGLIRYQICNAGDLGNDSRCIDNCVAAIIEDIRPYVLPKQIKEATEQRELVISLGEMPPEGLRIMEPKKYPSILIKPSPLQEQGDITIREDFESFYRRTYKKEPQSTIGDEGHHVWFGETSIAHTAWFAMQYLQKDNTENAIRAEHWRKKYIELKAPKREIVGRAETIAPLYVLIQNVVNAAHKHGWAQGRNEHIGVSPARLEELSEESFKAREILKQAIDTAITQIEGQ